VLSRELRERPRDGVRDVPLVRHAAESLDPPGRRERSDPARVLRVSGGDDAPHELAEVVQVSRLLYHNKDGYEMLTPPDEPLATAPRISHHRLIAYAHGELSDPWEPLEVDHLKAIPWLSYVDNIEAVTPEEHGRRTRRRAAERKARDAD